jgi:hypothetical protein
MKAWSNIKVPAQDPEIIKIDRYEKKLRVLPEKVYIIRELITRFEVCHFKYQQHLNNIKDSIMKLEPNIDPGKIGANHIQKGENAWRKDKTGRSKMGQQYVWAIRKWLGENPLIKPVDHFNGKLYDQINKWLGYKHPDKIRLVRLLLARLTWDWKSYQELIRGGEWEELELQVCSIDICHYAFPQNLGLILKGLGNMAPIEGFKGCGSFDKNRKSFVEKEVLILTELLSSLVENDRDDKNNSIRIWLFACLIKTIKEQVNLPESMIDLIN